MDGSEFTDALLRASPDGLLLVNGEGRIELANPSASSIFGLPVAELIGSSIDRLVPDEFRSVHHGHRRRFVNEPSVRPMGSGLELFAQHADGSLVPVEISLSPVTIDGVQHTIAAVRDVTDQQESRSQVTLLRDRERIARDLHDMVIQRLFAAGMGLQAVSGLAGNAVVDDRIAQTVDDLDSTIRELRSAIFALSRPVEKHGLAAEIVELVRSRRQQLGFEPTVNIDGALDDVSAVVAEHVIATLTESLSNVARHAEATAATVTVVVTATSVSLVVTDNGQGISPKPVRRGGLSNLMWRASELGGECVVSGAEPTGTKLAWSVPVRR